MPPKKQTGGAGAAASARVEFKQVEMPKAGAGDIIRTVPASLMPGATPLFLAVASKEIENVRKALQESPTIDFIAFTQACMIKNKEILDLFLADTAKCSFSQVVYALTKLNKTNASWVWQKLGEYLKSKLTRDMIDHYISVVHVLRNHDRTKPMYLDLTKVKDLAFTRAEPGDKIFLIQHLLLFAKEYCPDLLSQEYLDTLMVQVAKKNMPTLVPILSQIGANVDADSAVQFGYQEDGSVLGTVAMTPLMFAAAEGFKGVVTALLALKPPPKLDKGVNFCHSVTSSADVKSEVKAEVKTMTQGSTITGKTLRSILPGTTALMFAVEGGHFEVVQLLIEHGVDINAVDIEGNNAAFLALKWILDEKYIVIFQRLLEKGIDIYAFDSNDLTLAQIIEEYRKEGFITSVLYNQLTRYLQQARFSAEVIRPLLLLLRKEEKLYDQVIQRLIFHIIPLNPKTSDEGEVILTLNSLFSAIVPVLKDLKIEHLIISSEDLKNILIELLGLEPNIAKSLNIKDIFPIIWKHSVQKNQLDEAQKKQNELKAERQALETAQLHEKIRNKNERYVLHARIISKIRDIRDQYAEIVRAVNQIVESIVNDAEIKKIIKKWKEKNGLLIKIDETIKDFLEQFEMVKGDLVDLKIFEQHIDQLVKKLDEFDMKEIRADRKVVFSKIKAEKHQARLLSEQNEKSKDEFVEDVSAGDKKAESTPVQDKQSQLVSKPKAESKNVTSETKFFVKAPKLEDKSKAATKPKTRIKPKIELRKIYEVLNETVKGFGENPQEKLKNYTVAELVTLRDGLFELCALAMDHVKVLSENKDDDVCLTARRFRNSLAHLHGLPSDIFPRAGANPVTNLYFTLHTVTLVKELCQFLLKSTAKTDFKLPVAASEAVETKESKKTKGVSLFQVLCTHKIPDISVKQNSAIYMREVSIGLDALRHYADCASSTNISPTMREAAEWFTFSVRFGIYGKALCQENTQYKILYQTMLSSSPQWDEIREFMEFGKARRVRHSKEPLSTLVVGATVATRLEGALRLA